MYIQPNTDIHILTSVPLDNTYTDTLRFSNVSAQTNYFISKSKFNLSNYSYQRVNNGYMRVGIEADRLYDCNYLMFRNTAFGNKWFYAFINAVEYVNNETSAISFEIDVMQTWYFDYTVDACFVEREHTATDAIGQHIEAEGLNCGEYVYADSGWNPVEAYSTYYTIVSVVDTDGASSGNMYDGIYGGATLHAFKYDDVQGINDYINQFNQKPDAILAIYMIPTAFLNMEVPVGGTVINGIATGSFKYLNNVSSINGTESLDGYLPKNKKLYTYPYNFYEVDNTNGQSLSLRYEFFTNRTVKLAIASTITAPVECVLYPTGYKGIDNDTSIYFNESLSINAFPQCSWNVDTYKAWVAQNMTPALAIRLGGMAGTSMVSGVAGGISATSAIGQATNLLADAYTASMQADVCKGSQNNAGVNASKRMLGFHGGRMCVSSQYAQMIDDFFTRFGYRVNRVKYIDIDSRPHWNYVKTVSATITGSVPADDMRKICSIYDGGITFWANGDEVGSYLLDNSPA